MIHLKDSLYIDADKYQFILIEKRESKDGNAYQVPLGYCPTLETLIRGLSDRKLHELTSFLKSVRALQDDFADWAASIKSPLLSELKAAIEAYGKYEVLLEKNKELKEKLRCMNTQQQ